MGPNNSSKAGNQDHQAADEKIWKGIIDEIKIDEQSNSEREYLDLCCGDGRILRQVIFPLKNQFKTHTGVDISSTLIESFKNEISKLESSSKIDIIQQDVLDYEADEKRFALITACWCLGFFNDEQKYELLSKIKTILADDGVFILKESVKPKRSKKQGNDFYTGLTRKDYEKLFKKAGMNHLKVDELEFQYPGETKPK